MKMKLPSKMICYQMHKLKAGSLSLEGRPMGTEKGVILQVAKDVKEFKKGDNIVVAPWAPEVATFGDMQYYFIREDNPAILCSYEE